MSSYRHPKGASGRRLTQALNVQKVLCATLCRINGTNPVAHAVTLYDKDRKNYLFKNSYKNEPTITIPITRLPWKNQTSSEWHIFDHLCGIDISYK